MSGYKFGTTTNLSRQPVDSGANTRSNNNNNNNNTEPGKLVPTLLARPKQKESVATATLDSMEKKLLLDAATTKNIKTAEHNDESRQQRNWSPPRLVAPHATFASRLTPAVFISVFRPEEVQKMGSEGKGGNFVKKRKREHYPQDNHRERDRWTCGNRMKRHPQRMKTSFFSLDNSKTRLAGESH